MTLIDKFGANANDQGTDFFEDLNKDKIVVGRVKNVFLSKTDDENLGAVEVEPISPYNKTRITAYPFFPNSTSYPLIDEIVLCNFLPSETIGSSDANKKYYYLGVVNIWNNPHVNFYPDAQSNEGNIPLSEKKSIQEVQAGSNVKLAPTNPNEAPSTQYTFKERDNIHPLKPYAGDVINQGRFGNSIRFGSTNKILNSDESANDWSKSGTTGDPILILRNGQPLDKENLPDKPWNPIDEKINFDLSSIYLTSTQKIDINVANSNPKKGGGYLSYSEKEDTPTFPNDYEGNQVIINSGRLVFNTNFDHILLSSQKSISFSSQEGFHFDTPQNFVIQSGTTIKLGSKEAKEPLVMGETLRLNLELLCESLIELTGILKYQQVWPGGGAVPDNQLSLVANTSETILKDVIKIFQKDNNDNSPVLSNVSKTI